MAEYVLIQTNQQMGRQKSNRRLLILPSPHHHPAREASSQTPLWTPRGLHIMRVTKTGAGAGLSDDTFMKSGDGRIYWAEIDFEYPVVTYLSGCGASAGCKGERGN